MSVRRHGPTATLALLAYLPALLAAPGRMPADSKLYLYLDPGEFMRDAASTFDPGQFAGWVPHQHISYLWPAGPWFWVFDTAGVPDWIAHRLWIGSLMVAAGLGVRHCARLLGFGATAAFTAGVVYQVSLYVLPYVSRTSVMLLPWAGLGWIVALTIRATRRNTWGDPAAIALVVFTVGAVNATALAMIVPAPVLWILHSLWGGRISVRTAVAVAARTATLSVLVSSWWVIALVVQGRAGAEVLGFSESLADVSLTATSPEVWRLLGYWLFYVRDPFTATTTESLRYLSSTPAIAISFAVPVLCLVGLVWVRWAHRRFATALVVTGGVLAVGVHPIDDRSPLMRLLAGSDEGGLALALRSSTRAVPVLMLGLALAAAASIEAIPSGRARRTGGVAATLVVLANLPGLWSGAFVDPTLERDQDPPVSWSQAAATLAPRDRVLMVPGVEFGSYRWGHTVDQPLPGLTDATLVTRDLLPLGSPAAMDVLYAFDDRIQDGVVEPGSVAPTARLLGATTIWSTNDVAFDRYRTARPEWLRRVLGAADGIGPFVGFGDPVPNEPDIAVVDERSVSDPGVGSAAPPVELAPVEDASVVRAATATMVVVGSGDGLVDLAAAGLIDGREAVVYPTTSPEPDPSRIGAVVVTDTNRSGARHWRSSQDTRGMTEPGPGASGLIDPPVSDQRLEVFDATRPEAFTYAVQEGPVSVIATSYGEPFAYLPEHRPVMAVDGDPNTAWLVGEHGDPVGEAIQLWLAADAPGTGSLRLTQPTGDPTARRITEVVVTFDDATGQPITDTTVALTADSVGPPGQPVDVPAGTERVTIVISAVGGGTPGTPGAVAGVGLSEIDLGTSPVSEVVTVPSAGFSAVERAGADVPAAWVLTRWRTDPTDRWRDDPEPLLVRRIDVPEVRMLDASIDVRVDARTDDELLAALFDWPAWATSRLTGSLDAVGAAAFDGDPATAWLTAFGDASGAVLTVDEVSGPVQTMTITVPDGDVSVVRSVTVRSGEAARTVDLEPDGSTVARFDPPLPGGRISVVLDDVDVRTVVDRRFGDVVELPAGIAEIDLDGVGPVDLDSGPVVECVDLVRVGDRTVSATIDLVDWRRRLRVGAALDATVCGSAIEASGEVDVVAVGDPAPFVVDRVTLDDGVADWTSGRADRADQAEVIDVSGNRFDRHVEVRGCRSGCWLIVGEGFNAGWSASTPNADLGSATLVAGGFNGWWLEPGTESVRVRWGWQTPQNLAFVVTAAAVIAAVGLIARDRRRRRTAVLVPVEDRRLTAGAMWSWERVPCRRRRWFVLTAWAVPAALLAGPVWGAFGLVGGVVADRRRKVPWDAMTTLASVLVIAVAVVVAERRDPPFPGGGWPVAFESLHWVGMFAFAMLATSALTDDGRDDEQGDDDGDDDDLSGTSPVGDGPRR